jgi:hypothetical protein
MNGQCVERRILVALPESAVGALLQMNDCLNAGLAASLRDILGSKTEPANDLVIPA